MRAVTLSTQQRGKDKLPPVSTLFSNSSYLTSPVEQRLPVTIHQMLCNIIIIAYNDAMYQLRPQGSYIIFITHTHTKKIANQAE